MLRRCKQRTEQSVAVGEGGAAAGIQHVDEETAPFEQVKAVLRQRLHLEYGVETGDEDDACGHCGSLLPTAKQRPAA